jgi:hypothetical protein
VDADYWLAQFGELDDQVVLAGRQVDVGCIDALAH